MNTNIKNVLKGTTMGAVVSAALFMPMMAEAQTPNNYIGTDGNGVISERVGNDPNNVITRDMATQDELNTAKTTTTFLTNEVRGRDAATNDRIDDLAADINRVDQEDHRVVDASVNADGKLVLHSQDMDGGSKRNLTTNVQITGQDGSNGTNGSDGATGAKGDTGATGAAGKDAIAPLGSLSFAAASASFYGDGVGIGLSASNYSDLEGSFVLGFDLDNDWRAVVGITTDFNNRHAVTVGVGYSF